MTRSEQVARTAARWWADRLRNDFNPLGRNGEPEEPLTGGLMAAVHVRMQAHVTPEKIDAFEETLTRLMREELDGESTSYFFAMRFSTDYGPSTGLGDALVEAGLPDTTGLLPIKTTVWADGKGVRVGDGYGAAPKNIPLLAVSEC